MRRLAPMTRRWSAGLQLGGLGYVQYYRLMQHDLTSSRLLQAFVKKLSKQQVLNEGLTIYRRLQGDDQDSVRLLTVEDLIAIAQQLSPAEVKEQLLKQIRQSMTDKSWRVRYMSASHFNEVNFIVSFVGICSSNDSSLSSPKPSVKNWSGKSSSRTMFSS